MERDEYIHDINLFKSSRFRRFRRSLGITTTEWDQTGDNCSWKTAVLTVRIAKNSYAFIIRVINSLKKLIAKNPLELLAIILLWINTVIVYKSVKSYFLL